MNDRHMLIDINEASAKITNFIGTKRFDEIVSCVNNDARSGFMAGMAFALCLAMTECKCYVDPEKLKEE